MKQRSFFKALSAMAIPAAVGLVMLFSNVTRAGDRDDDKESRVKIGFQIAPVPLNLKGKNCDLVGYGSYLINAVAGCNGCHTNSPPTEYAPGGNPYLRFPFFTGTEKINTATYLAGGRDFGPIGSVPHIYSRNLTPDKTGRAEGGHTFREFVAIMRHGTDFDDVHPNCTGPSTPNNCFAPPFNGDVLQVMPWPVFQSMTDRDLRAMYEYLSAIPCNPGPVIAGAPYLQNVCN
jgi:hypothetical protein